jgi:NAD(P)H dehydrogenase (quinone)
MYAITGITGQVGSVVAENLLKQGQKVRAVVRDASKGRAWSDRGCEVALATFENAASLTAAFRGAEGVFILVPPNFDPLPDFPEARSIGETLKTVLMQADPARAVYLSTIGAQAMESNLLTQHTIIEKVIGGSPSEICPRHRLSFPDYQKRNSTHRDHGR